jgi:Protein of unknown function (DUF2950)
MRPLLLLAAASLLGCSSAPKATTYDSAGAAVESLIAALRSGDTKQLASALGPGGGEIVSSGDEVADRQHIERFLRAYDVKHALAPSDDGMTLTVGEKDWPFPVPLVEEGGRWRFDGEAGRDEILARRIGENELSAIQVCLAVVDAEREYARRRPEGGDLPVYAPKLLSDPGKRNGLYWQVKDGEEPSPMGPLVAEAEAEGYSQGRKTAGSPAPYHGYRYRLLTAQGPHAEGGAMDYLVNGKLLAGFALVAYPAEYENSGIMTFIVNEDGVVYQRDLGRGTEKAAKEMKTFDPAPGWEKTATDKDPAADATPPR